MIARKLFCISLMLTSFIVVFGPAQTGVSREELAAEINKVYPVFQKHAKPELLRFAEAALDPSLKGTPAGKSFVENKVLYFSERMNFIKAVTEDYFLKERIATISQVELKAEIHRKMAYEIDLAFPGLPFGYFKKVKEELGLN